ncbi:hypothetical protein [Abyssisolibacter fermentans]|uniref:hypothetical protein n=1 Tax=Abyssisolibacter fermentans TaxID=1766203 RepID=UPI00083705A2|nr:hypothetical protein [Abyssisolibacter fermentans]
MSEFTSGNLILSKHKNVIDKNKIEGIKIGELNSKWTVILTENDYLDEVPEYIINISKETPVMIFLNFEDHGWGYKIINNKKELANIYVDYELVFTMITQKAEERYPNEDDIIEFLFSNDTGKDVHENLYDEVYNSSEYKNAVEEQFKNKNVEVFELFGLDTKDINKLTELLTADTFFKGRYMRDQVENFKEILGIIEMEWVNYNLTDTLNI